MLQSDRMQWMRIETLWWRQSIAINNYLATFNTFAEGKTCKFMQYQGTFLQQTNSQILGRQVGLVSYIHHSEFWFFWPNSQTLVFGHQNQTFKSDYFQLVPAYLDGPVQLYMSVNCVAFKRYVRRVLNQYSVRYNYCTAFLKINTYHYNEWHLLVKSKHGILSNQWYHFKH